MVANPIWIAGYGGTPTGGASPVWIAPNDGSVPAAVQSWIAAYEGQVAGAAPVWVAGYGKPVAGASPIWIGGYLTSGIGVLPGSPVNTVAPVASGTTTVGSTLSCTTGTWTNSPTSYQYAWSGAGSPRNASTYVVVAGDAGRSITCTVTAVNAIGPGLSAASNALSILGVPANTAAPVASGSLTVGSTLTTTNGTWTNSPTFTYQWQRGGTNISGATSSTYVTVSADGGTSVGCLVTATNSSGSASQASNTLAIAAGGSTSVWSAADAATNGMTLTNGGLTVTPVVSAWQSIRGSIGKTSGKLYVEFLGAAITTGDTYQEFGLASAGFVSNSYLGSSNYSGGIQPGGPPGNFSAGFASANAPATTLPTSNDVWALAVDFAGNVWIARNNIWLTGNPATGTLPTMTFVPATVGTLFPALSLNQGVADGVWTLKPTPASQTYLPPPGFQAWDGGPVTPSTSVWSAADAAANGATLSNGGLTVTSQTSGVTNTVRSTIGKTSGKLYAEMAVDASLASTSIIFGLASAGFNAASYLGGSTYSGGAQLSIGTYVSAGFTGNYTAHGTMSPNCVIGVAVDFAAGSIWIAVNNSWIASLGKDPASGSLPVMSFVPATVGPLFLGLSINGVAGTGVWTLQPTAASQTYAPPAGFSAWDGAGGHSAQAVAYLARTVGGNEGGNGANIANLIDGLVADGVWAKLDALYVLAQQNSTDALLNLVGTNYPLMGSATFTVYQGFSGWGGGGLVTGFNPTVGTLQYTQNSANIGVWSYAAASGESSYQIGDGVNSELYVWYIDNNFYPRVNNISTGGIAHPGVSGLFVADRSASAQVVGYWNGNSVGTFTGTSAALTSGVVAVGPSTIEKLSAAFIGASLGSAGQLALYNRLRTYLTAVGVP